MKNKIILIIISMLVFTSVAGAIPSIDLPMKSKGKGNAGMSYSHTILGEYFTQENCTPAKFASRALKNLYYGGYHPFYYVTLLYDVNKKAKERHDELNVTASPTVVWDGGFKKDVGSEENIQKDMNRYNTSIIACGNRDVKDIDLNLDVDWLGAVNPNPPDNGTDIPVEQCLGWQITAMNINVTVDSNESSQYNGHLHVYVTECNSSYWYDTGGMKYAFGFLDYGFNGDVTISSGGTWNNLGEWDGADHNNGYGEVYDEIYQDNCMVIASIFDKDNNNFTDETAGFLAGNGNDPKTWDFYFGNTTPPPQVLWNSTIKTYNPPDNGTLLFNTTYYWKVDVWDNQGNVIYGDIWSFTTRDNNPPYELSDPIPPDGATNCSGGGLCWTGGDPDNDLVTYDVYFGNSSPPPKIIANQTSNCTSPPWNLEFNTTYYWKIVAWDSYDASTEGPIWSFITEENLPPYEPSNPHPPNGGIFVPVDVILSWNGTDPNHGDILKYDVYFDDVNPPRQVESNWTYSSWDPPYNLTINMSYYWKIVTWDSGGLSTSGPCWIFTTGINHPPGAPIIKGPKGKPVLKSLSFVKPGSKPLPKPGISYNFTFKAIDPDGHDLYYWIDWGDGTTSGWIGPYPSGEEVKRNHTWSWKGTYMVEAKAKDIYGAEGPWGTMPIPIQPNRFKINLLFCQILERLLSYQ